MELINQLIMTTIKFIGECCIKTAAVFLVGMFLLGLLTLGGAYTTPFFLGWHIVAQFAFIMYSILLIGIAIMWCTEDLQ